MSKKPSVAPPPPTKPGGQGGTTRIDVGDLSEVVTKSVTRALGVQSAAKLPIRIIIGLILEPPDFLKGGGGGGPVEQ